MPTSGVQRRWSVVLVSVQAVPSFRGFARTLLIPRTPDRPYRSHLSPITLLSRRLSFNFHTHTPLVIALTDIREKHKFKAFRIV